ncbi:hypothetical protein DPMN_108432 [Dreissena polymorpha]|uniref:Uncharacterized protein n=1 Tax=Dreissena polymorpha TaxID=45954 RepID=A0A9D4QKZ3_DREPO|nr:hypothetical protein DPMN_108432 [Dreissena polymorpha]
MRCPPSDREFVGSLPTRGVGDVRSYKASYALHRQSGSVWDSIGFVKELARLIDSLPILVNFPHCLEWELSNQTVFGIPKATQRI